MKSLPVAYALWLLGGWWGAHHLYLGRDGQAALYCSTLGGFLLGWVRDAWRLPAYVDWANGATEQVELLRVTYRLRPKQPPISPLVLAVQLFCGAWFGMLAADALNLLQVWPVPRFPTLERAGGYPELIAALLTRPQLLRLASVVLRALGVSVGVWLAGNAHRCHHSSLVDVLSTSLLAQLSSAFNGSRRSAAAEALDPMSAYATDDFSWVVVLGAMFAYNYYRSWSREALDLIGVPAPGAEPANAAADPPPVAGAAGQLPVFQPPRLPRRGSCKTRWRLLRFLAFSLLFCALLSSFALHLSVVTPSPLPVPMKVALFGPKSTPDSILHGIWATVLSTFSEIHANGFSAWALRVTEGFVREAEKWHWQDFMPEELIHRRSAQRTLPKAAARA